MLMSTLYACFFPHMHTCCPQELEKDIRCLETGVMDGYKPLCDCWEPNQGPLQEQECSWSLKFRAEDIVQLVDSWPRV